MPQLSQKARELLAIEQDRVAAHKQKELNELRAMNLNEFLMQGLHIDNVSFELAGRMYKQDWIRLSYDGECEGWKAYKTNNGYCKVSIKQIEDMLEAIE